MLQLLCFFFVLFSSDVIICSVFCRLFIVAFAFCLITVFLREGVKVEYLQCQNLNEGKKCRCQRFSAQDTDHSCCECDCGRCFHVVKESFPVASSSSSVPAKRSAENVATSDNKPAKKMKSEPTDQNQKTLFDFSITKTVKTVNNRSVIINNASQVQSSSSDSIGFPCDNCSRKFLSNAGLVSHMYHKHDVRRYLNSATGIMEMLVVRHSNAPWKHYVGKCWVLKDGKFVLPLLLDDDDKDKKNGRSNNGGAAHRRHYTDAQKCEVLEELQMLQDRGVSNAQESIASAYQVDQSLISKWLKVKIALFAKAGQSAREKLKGLKGINIVENVSTLFFN